MHHLYVERSLNLFLLAFYDCLLRISAASCFLLDYLCRNIGRSQLHSRRSHSPNQKCVVLFSKSLMICPDLTIETRANKMAIHNRTNDAEPLSGKYKIKAIDIKKLFKYNFKNNKEFADKIRFAYLYQYEDFILNRIFKLIDKYSNVGSATDRIDRLHEMFLRDPILTILHLELKESFRA